MKFSAALVSEFVIFTAAFGAAALRESVIWPRTPLLRAKTTPSAINIAASQKRMFFIGEAYHNFLVTAAVLCLAGTLAFSLGRSRIRARYESEMQDLVDDTPDGRLRCRSPMDYPGRPCARWGIDAVRPYPAEHPGVSTRNSRTASVDGILMTPQVEPDTMDGPSTGNSLFSVRLPFHLHLGWR